MIRFQCPVCKGKSRLEETRGSHGTFFQHTCGYQFGSNQHYNFERLHREFRLHNAWCIHEEPDPEPKQA